MNHTDLIELLNEIDMQGNYSNLVIVAYMDDTSISKFAFYFKNKFIGYIVSKHSIVINAINELGDIDPRVTARIYLNCNFIDLQELNISFSIDKPIQDN